jgi:hypothetical protein
MARNGYDVLADRARLDRPPSTRRPGMRQQNRREFLRTVGSGMLVVGVGASLAAQFGCSRALALDADDALSFGELGPLVDLMQLLPPERLQVELVGKLRRGEADLRQLVAAAALANAETFGGEDYVGYHAAMALVPAREIARAVPAERLALPLLKVVYRNSAPSQAGGGAARTTLGPLRADAAPAAGLGNKLRDASRRADLGEAERLFAGLSAASVDERLNALLPMVEDDMNVHRFVLAHRARELVDVVGPEQAQTILRQCVRFCVDEERSRRARGNPPSAIRELLPELLERHALLDGAPGGRDPGDESVERLCDAIYFMDAADACDAVAAALADGVSPEAAGESIALAANQLLLRQSHENWRTHGDSAGVHASDAANAWRNIGRVADERNRVAGLLVAAYHTARFGAFDGPPYPTDAQRELVATVEADALLGIAEEAIRGNDQAAAAAAVQVYGEQGHAADGVFALMRKYAVSEGGRLHAEKYYRTVVEEYATIRPAFRWRQLVALARVTASAYGHDREDRTGHRASGYEDACRRLGVAV